MTEGLHAELAETNVGVTVVMPGAVETPIGENSGVQMPAAPNMRAHTLAAPSAVARAILDGMERGHLYVLPGRDARFLNVAMRVAPKWTMRLIEKQMRELLG